MTHEAPQSLIRLHPLDHVAIAMQALSPGQTVSLGSGCGNGEPFVCRGQIPPGHKIAISAIAEGDRVLKYGQNIGRATQPISVGEHVHSHNLADHHTVDTGQLHVSPPPSPPSIRRSFAGYQRHDGRVGTRNYVAIVSTVNCSATVCHRVASRFTPERMQRWPNVDGVFAATHTTGCALDYHGIKHQMLGRVLAGYAQHSNVGGCLIIGLGCEQTTGGYLQQHHGIVSLYAPSGERLTRDNSTPMLTMQTEGGTRATIDKAEKLVEELLDRANTCTRKDTDAAQLILAVECGGSDGYSGLTANPAVGVVSDRIVACGGTSVISETTELYGAEHLLVARSRSEAVARKLIERIEWWKQHVAMFGGQIDNNPSVGNKAGGLTTITEKSLGAVSKSGSTALEEVYDYAEPVTSAGLVVMDTPGFDPSSVTGKVAGGANLVMFTTGRGSCFGCKPTPVIKVATHSRLFESMRDDMDLDAGTILTGETVEQAGERFFEFALRVASGEATASERLGLGDHEFVPWTVGPVL